MSTRKPKRQRHAVGDDVALEGHCMVAFPDGSVVTASRSIKLVMDGDYRLIYPDREITLTTKPARRGPTKPAGDEPAGDEPAGDEPAV